MMQTLMVMEQEILLTPKRKTTRMYKQSIRKYSLKSNTVDSSNKQADSLYNKLLKFTPIVQNNMDLVGKVYGECHFQSKMI